MEERFAKIEHQVGRLLEDLDKLRRENVSLRAENAKLNDGLQERLNQLETMEATSARFLRLKEEHTRFKQERSQIRRETRSLLRRVRALRKGQIA